MIHLPHPLALSVLKVVGAFLPGTLIFAVGADGVAHNPITVDDVAMMVAGLGLIYFGRIMLQTRESVIALEVRVKDLEDKNTTKDAALSLAEGIVKGVKLVMEEKRRDTDTQK